jgi:hypothetical protein
MDEFIKALPSFVGVVIGGLITFLIQIITIRKQQKWERNKIELDNFYKDETIKFQTFNKIFQLDGKYSILDIDLHYGPELNQENYFEHIRPLLFEIFHLLDDNMAKEVNNIEGIYERQYVTEDEDPNDKESLSQSYSKILQLIRKQFNDFREIRKNILFKK